MATIESIEIGRKQDGNRSIADKIVKRLHDLEKTVENNMGRWAWELLQNAKDSVADENGANVSIRIELGDNLVVFRHNGIHFTEWDIRGLINQISSKEVEDGVPSRKTGKFGTGFLTTHLLSKFIGVGGIVKAQSGEFYQFSFPLDRSEKKVTLLAEKIEETWRKFHESTRRINTRYNKSGFDTSFSYPLQTPEQHEIAKKGVDEFLSLVPLALAFNPGIARVEVSDKTRNVETAFDAIESNHDSDITWIRRTQNGKVEEIPILMARSARVQIAAILQKTVSGYAVKDMSRIPKIFCDFPLIGTEDFHFPVVVNSFFFNPQTERDGIWLKGANDPEVEENQRLLLNAAELYQKLVNGLEGKPYFNLYNLADTRTPAVSEKYLDIGWYEESIQTPMRDFLFETPIVEAPEPGKRLKPSTVWIAPKSYSKAAREKIWQYTYDQFSEAVCGKAHLEQWSSLSWDGWNRMDYNELTDDLAKPGNIDALAESLGRDQAGAFSWLNEVCEFIQEEDSNLALFDKKKFVPNRNGEFSPYSQLYINQIDDDTLIEILRLLGDDWNRILLHDDVGFGKYKTKDKESIASEITQRIKKAQQKGDQYNQAVILLSQWLEGNEVDGPDLFSELYQRRAEIFMDTIEDKDSLYTVMRSKLGLAKVAEVTRAIEANPSLLDNFAKVEEVNGLMKEFNITSVTELKQALQLAEEQAEKITRTPITEETLIQLGVGSIRELEEALKDKDIAAHFTHESTPRVEMFRIVQKLIQRSKKNVLAQLARDQRYDCTHPEEIAPTVIGGIFKLGQPVYIVVRPSDKGEVIIYYSSERDTLEQPDAELWIDDGVHVPRQLTLGEILKTTGINRIPL